MSKLGNNVVKKHSISSELAQKMVDEAVAKARKLGIAVNAEVKAGQRAGAKPGQFAARRRVRSAASASAEMAGVS